MAGKLHWADWLLFVLFLAASIGIGIYHALTGGKQSSTAEFLLDDRKLKVLPTMISLLVSFQSAIMMLGNAAEMYTRGIQVWFLTIIAYCFALLIVERMIVPWIYPLKLTSIFEYLEMRYKSRVAKGIGVAIGIVSSMVYMGLAMYAPSIALETATGLSVYWSIPLMAIVCTIYTSIGGMRAVIWTDVFQFGVMVAGMLGVLIKGNMIMGGFGRVMEFAGKEGRLNYINLDPDPRVRHTLWGLTIAQTILNAKIYGLNQSSVQRFTSTPTEREARLILLSNIPPLIILKSMACMTGITMLAYASQLQCDPMASGEITNSNQLLPWFVMEIFKGYYGFMGVFLATLYSGALSSVSSSLSACSAITWANIIKPHFNISKLSDVQSALINKITVVVFGILSCGLSFLAVQIPGPITQIAGIMFGSIGGPQIAIFMLGGCFKTTEWIGVSVGCATSFVVMLWISIGARLMPPGHQPRLPPVSTANCTDPLLLNSTTSMYTTTHSYYGDQTTQAYLAEEAGPHGRPLHGLEHIYGLSYLWYAALGTIIAFVVGLSVSLIVRKITGEDADDVPDDMMIPFRKVFSLDVFRNTKEKEPLPKAHNAEHIEQEKFLLEKPKV